MIRFARVLPGATQFNVENVSRTFRGQILTDDGQTRQGIIKDIPAKELANELLGSTLASAIGLPTPDAYLAVVPNGDLDVLHAPHVDERRVCFATVDAQVPSVRFIFKSANAVAGQKVLKDLLEWDRIGDAIAFDTWIANVDRNIGNVLWGGKDKVWLIDHGKCLTGSTWGLGDLVADGVFANKLATVARNMLSGIERLDKLKAASQIIEHIKDLDVAEARATSRVDGVLSCADCDAGFVFVDERRASVSKKTSEALALPYAA